MIYYALIGDLVGSRDLEARGDVQERLKGLLVEVNAIYADMIAARFTITLGDEFQGLLTDPAPLLSIMDRIRLSIYPVKIRFGVGIGTMSTAVDASAAIGADGPAYHAAREGLRTVKEMNGRYEQPFVDTLFYKCDATGRIYLSMDMLNANLSLAGAIREKWTPKQYEVIAALEAGGAPLRSLAEQIGVNHSSLQRRLDKANYYTYRRNRDVCAEHLINAREVNHEQ